MSDIFIESAGTGEPVLFIHGLGGTSNVFMPQCGILTRFFSCHRFDLPGAGLSASDGQNTIAALVDSTISVINKVSPNGRIHIIAHSLGTIIAQHLALQILDRIRSLVLIGPVHAPGDAARAAILARAAKARADGLADIADQIVLAGTSAETKASRPEVAAFVRELIMRQSAEGYAHHCEALAGAQPAYVSKITAPALLITGDEDNTSPPPAAQALAMKFPHATLKILGRTGHWTTLERPREVNELIINFLLAQKH